MARVRVGYVSDQDAFLINMVPGHGPFHVPAGTRQKRPPPPSPFVNISFRFYGTYMEKISLLEITELFQS